MDAPAAVGPARVMRSAKAPSVSVYLSARARSVDQTGAEGAAETALCSTTHSSDSSAASVTASPSALARSAAQMDAVVAVGLAQTRVPASSALAPAPRSAWMATLSSTRTAPRPNVALVNPAKSWGRPAVAAPPSVSRLAAKANSQASVPEFNRARSSGIQRVDREGRPGVLPPLTFPYTTHRRYVAPPNGSLNYEMWGSPALV